MKKHILLFTIALLLSAIHSSADEKLRGTYIGSGCWDYSVNGIVNNGQQRAFDGNGNTYFATEERSYGWVGMDLGQKYVITKVGWQPRNEASVGAARVKFGVFQGANNADFTDAVPIYMITETGTIGVMDHADVDCSRGFRYVRYVGPSGSRCNIGDLEFYGHAGAGDDSHLWQPTGLPTVCINTLNSKEPFDKETEIAG
ncbi:MAG: discoidin domain-containing protein, partial [Muribaculaceae bacterium]|nr:discoidin domain-containing protein [Muribaculaceae bacterium]